MGPEEQHGQPIDAERLRIVVMLTDGYIGNEAEIIEHVGKNCGDQIRFWAIGMGQAPNMFLIDGVARQGGGMGKKLGLNDDTVEGLARRTGDRRFAYDTYRRFIQMPAPRPNCHSLETLPAHSRPTIAGRDPVLPDTVRA